MARTLSCRDVGADCDWHTCADTEEEVMRQAAIHAEEAHGMTEIPPEMMEKAKAAIKEGPCPTATH